MSTVHENLKAALSRARPGDTEAHKDIYSFIQQNFDELSADSKTVPLHTLTYTIRRILYPQFLLGRIPELLDYLWHVDKYRQRAIEISSQIITWQKFYKSDADSRGRVRLLSAKDEKAIAGFEDKQRVAGSRDAFCECAIRCCRLHIYYLCCTAEESHLLPARLRAFFPGLSQNDSDSLLAEQFHWDFTDQERENLNEAGRQTVEFLKEEAGWEENRETFWKENGLSMDNFYDDAFKSEFTEAWKLPFDLEETTEWIEAYMKRVEKMVQKLEDVFNSSTASKMRNSSLSSSVS